MLYLNYFSKFLEGLKMKKLFAILVAFLFAATFSFAQNTSTVTQTSNTNTANVNQTGSNQSSIVLQNTGNTNKATINQLTDNGGIQTSNVTQMVQTTLLKLMKAK